MNQDSGNSTDCRMTPENVAAFDEKMAEQIGTHSALTKCKVLFDKTAT